jgi:hypothetical protein
MKRKISKQCVGALVATVITFVVASSVMAEPATAAVSRVQGGSAESQASCISSSRQVYVKSWVYKDRGSAQTVASKVELYNNNARTWWYGDPIQEYTLQTSLYIGVSGTPAIFERRISVPPGSHYVRVWYGWLTTQGYQWLKDDLGWCNF